MLLLLKMNIISVYTQYPEDYFQQQHSEPADQLYCLHHILSSASHDIICCGNNLSDHQILCNDRRYHCLSFYILSYFHPFQSAVDQRLVEQQTTLKDCCSRFVYWFSFVLNYFNVYFVHFNMETENAHGDGRNVNVNGKRVKNSSISWGKL